GVPAIVLGALARRDIDRSNGTLAGRGIAAGGILAGFFGTGLGYVFVLATISSVFTTDASEVPSSTASTLPASATTATALPTPTLAVAPAPTPDRTHSYGLIEVVDLDVSRPLRTQLVELVHRSRGRTVLLQTHSKSSRACADITEALPDRRMQRALANVTIIRVDVDEYDTELGLMEIQTTGSPWFYKLGPDAEPTDAISADAWNGNDPEKMAPALARFVKPAPPKHAPRSPRSRPRDP
ncbi:MAG TPA: DUF4190 domain-containing protein, partial [Labilithrix sp.]|nr:DUF4190 domain-containing protein [Labilithrix sp.]